MLYRTIKFAKIAIENNIKFCMEELDKYDNQFKESFINNKHENINILYCVYDLLYPSVCTLLQIHHHIKTL